MMIMMSVDFYTPDICLICDYVRSVDVNYGN